MIIKAKTEKDKFKFLHGQDMTPTLEYTKYLRETGASNGYSKDRSYRHIGEIPTLLYYEYLKKYPELIDGDRAQQHKILRKIFAEHPELRVSQGGI